MTITLVPSVDDRPVPRVSNLAARGGFRDPHWRKVRRRLDPHDVTPFDAESPRSLPDRFIEWYAASRWASWAVLAIGLALLAAAGARLAMALANWWLS
jgi:hypothetical protein